MGEKLVRITAGEVREWAEGTLEGWLTGYTDILKDGHQRKIIVMDDGTYKAEVRSEPELDQYFRVTVSVEEVDALPERAVQPGGPPLTPGDVGVPLEVVPGEADQDR